MVFECERIVSKPDRRTIETFVIAQSVYSWYRRASFLELDEMLKTVGARGRRRRTQGSFAFPFERLLVVYFENYTASEIGACGTI